MAVQDIGEENIQGTLLSEPQRKGHVRKFRKGFNTTFKHKISACAKFKQLIENNQRKLDRIISENIHINNLIKKSNNNKTFYRKILAFFM